MLRKQVAHKEQIMIKYGIPLPAKPPFAVTTALDVEEITDRYIYRQIYRGIQDFLHIHMTSVTQSVNAGLRKEFMKLLAEEVQIFDNFVEYGKLKGWTLIPPHYK